MKLLRQLLLPFSMLYGSITYLRNVFYDQGWLKSKRYRLPVISVGNLSVGGTGKSPMIELLIELLRKDHKVAVLSRGYKRKTKGYLEVLQSATAEEVGDEPLQFKHKFPAVTVAVCADRQEGIAQLQKRHDVILLDDAFQHRRVTPSYSILLTPFNDLYIDDWMLPTGNLREPGVGSKRADLIVVTKCPPKVPYAKMQEIEYRLQLQPHQKLYFSAIGYSENMVGASEILPLTHLKDKKFTLVTGIANPKPLTGYLKENKYTFEHLAFPDHHHFSTSEISELQKKELILTTEKDYMRLKDQLNKFAFYYLPINTQILKGQEDFFAETIQKAVASKN